ncbi:MAG: permease [Candidatus Omnitrophica bacterium]|nr:permease [Candidatus Omnitrophota bacterium]
MIDLFFNFIAECVHLWIEMAPYLLFGMCMAGLLHVFLGKDLITEHLGKPGIWSVIKATMLGVPLPVCSCGVVPIASSLEKEGAHKSSILAFLVSTPTTGVDSIFATYSLLGPMFALFRPLAAIISGITLGVADYIVEGKSIKQKESPKHEHPPIHIIFKWKEFLKYSFHEIPQDIGQALIIGIAIGGAISAFIPQSFFERFFFFPVDFLVALLIGIPLYVCSTGSIPVAVSLIQKGFSPGAGLVFLIAGPATNAVTLSFVRSKMGKVSFYLYLFNIIIVATLLGLLFNFLTASGGMDTSFLNGAGQMLPINLRIVSGLILFILVANGLIRQKTCKIKGKPDIVFFVPDIHCKQCAMTIKSALDKLEGINTIIVDTQHKTVNIFGQPDKQKVIAIIKKAGYNPNLSDACSDPSCACA